MSGLTFFLQSGPAKEAVTVDAQEIAIRDLREEAVRFVRKHYPNHGRGEALVDHILLYRHDLRSINILQLITSSADIVDGTLVEIVISSCPHHERLVVHPHTLYVHSYKTPTFCDFCGELLFGLVKQGLKCQGCGLNYHKRCASKIPNNCNGSRQRRPSAIPLSPSNSVGIHSTSTLMTTLSAMPGGAQSNLYGSVSITPSEALANLKFSDSLNPSASPAHPLNTPDIFVTTEQNDNGDLIGGNMLQMPRKDRSSSWSGRPLWMEVAEATRVKVPHTFQVHSYKRPTMCHHCKKLLKGLIRQGIQCRDCKYNCHKKCADAVPKDCPGNASNAIQEFLLGASDDKRNFGGSMESLSMNSLPFDEDEHHAEGSIDDSGLRMPAHKRAQVAPSAPLETTEDEDFRKVQPEENDVNESQYIPLMRIVMSKKQTKRHSVKILREGWMVHYTDKQHMRKKHYWRLDTKSIIMYKDENSTGYYKELPLNEILDVKTLVAPHAPLQEQLTHYFEIRTHTAVYCIAQVPATSQQQAHVASDHRMLDKGGCCVNQPMVVTATVSGAPMAPPSPDHYPLIHFTARKQSFFDTAFRFFPAVHRPVAKRRDAIKASMAFLTGINKNRKNSGAPCDDRGTQNQADNATSWSTAIKQALMPVTPQSSTAPTAPKGSDSMVQLKVPIPGETGHLGVQIQSEQEFSQLYQIFADEVLGSGQFGTVYGGIHRKSGKHVAVKLIDKLKFPSNKEAALRTEVDILQKVRHPGVVEFQQMLETPDRIFVVMEKLKGDMLEMILSSEKGRLSERITQFLVHQILVALHYLHSQNIVHCDLKPENILLSSDSDFPQVKLCDFGFARIIGERSFRRSVVGTPAYLAPEVLRNKGFNRSLDMWSVGVIVYVSLSGTFPFNEDEDINDQIQNAEFMYPPTPWRDISDNAIDFINGLLQVKMSKRLTVSKSLAHIWLQNYQLWCDLRNLEKEVGERFVTHESDDARWSEYERSHGLQPVYV